MDIVTEDKGPIKPAWNVMMIKKRSRRKAVAHPCLHSLSRHRRERIVPFLQVMKHMVPSLLALAALKYQGKAAETLFVENPIPIWCFLSSTCVYWLSVGASKQIITSEYQHEMMLWRIVVASALLSVISLVSIFLPYHHIVSHSLLAIWAPLPLVLAWPVLNDGYMLLVHKIRTCRVAAWVRRSCNKESESAMPV